MAVNVNLEFRDILVGPAANFRNNINYNFGLIKTALDQMQNEIVADVQGKLDGMQTQINNINTQLSGGVGVDIKVQKDQPTGQKKGDFWYKIL